MINKHNSIVSIADGTNALLVSFQGVNGKARLEVTQDGSTIEELSIINDTEYTIKAECLATECDIVLYYSDEKANLQITVIMGKQGSENSDLIVYENGKYNFSALYYDVKAGGQYDSKLSETSTNAVQNRVITAELNEVFTSVSNGKELIASAITDKGIPTAKDATFDQMANNISNLVTVPKPVVEFLLNGNLNYTGTITCNPVTRGTDSIIFENGAYSATNHCDISIGGLGDILSNEYTIMLDYNVTHSEGLTSGNRRILNVWSTNHNAQQQLIEMEKYSWGIIFNDYTTGTYQYGRGWIRLILRRMKLASEVENINKLNGKNCVASEIKVNEGVRVANADTIIIGHNTYQFNGLIKNLRVFDRVLTDEQLQPYIDEVLNE